MRCRLAEYHESKDDAKDHALHLYGIHLPPLPLNPREQTGKPAPSRQARGEGVTQ